VFHALVDFQHVSDDDRHRGLDVVLWPAYRSRILGMAKMKALQQSQFQSLRLMYAAPVQRPDRCLVIFQIRLSSSVMLRLG
jgi:hypothetical protein